MILAPTIHAAIQERRSQRQSHGLKALGKVTHTNAAGYCHNPASCIIAHFVVHDQRGFSLLGSAGCGVTRVNQSRAGRSVRKLEHRCAYDVSITKGKEIMVRIYEWRTSAWLAPLRR
jgi:hypothetical protein